jgi:hypothetical protein
MNEDGPSRPRNLPCTAIIPCVTLLVALTAIFAYAKILFMLMLMLKCCERKMAEK